MSDRPKKRTPHRLTWLGSIFAAALLGLCSVARAGIIVDEPTKSVDGLAVYIGFIPAEILKDHYPPHAERQGHGGIPNDVHAYHLVVAIFDAKTGMHVTDAMVAAEVSPLGHPPGLRKTLEPMEIAGTKTYGRSFEFPSDGGYVASLKIERPSLPKPTTVKFNLDHRPGHDR